MPTEKLSKSFKKIANNILGDDVKKVIALQDTTFFVTNDCEIFFCGRYSYNSNQLVYYRATSRSSAAGLIQ